MKLRALWLGASMISLAWCAQASAQTSAQATAPSSSAQSPSPPQNAAPTAAGSVAEVVVTGERRTTNLQTTPIAATVLNQEQLLKNGIVTVDQLQFVSPSLAVDNFGQGDNIDIRGIGKGEHNSQTLTGVITYRDGVATFPGYAQEEPYYDIANVEILRGPQGTFSGQSATGGAIIVNTQDPKINGGYTGYLFGHFGNYDDGGLQGAVNLPINDTLAARVAFNTETRDSFYHLTGETGDPNLYWGSARLSLLWTPTSQFRLLLKTDYSYLDNGGYFGDPLVTNGQATPTNNLFDVTVDPNIKTVARDEIIRQVVRADYTFSDGIDFRSVSGFQQASDAWKQGLGSAVVSIEERVPTRIWSQEFNLISPDKGFVTWVLGAYFSHTHYSFPHFDVGFPPGVLDTYLNGVNLTHTYAGFGQVSFNLPAGFQLQVGGRYSAWSSTNKGLYSIPEYAPFYDQTQDQQTSGNNLTGKITLNWNLDSANFLYAFVATGAKPGGLNGSLYAGPAVPIPAPFKQEYVVDYEIGWKSRFFDNHLRTQLGAYYNDFHHFQVSLPLPNDPQFSTEQNDPNSTKLYGVEASAQAVFGGLSINANLGLEHTSLGQFYAEDSRIAIGGTCNPETGPSSPFCINLKDHPQTYAPSVTYNFQAQYDYRLTDKDTVTPAVTFAHVSSQWGTVFDNPEQGDYLGSRNIFGASLAWTRGTFTTTLYGYNLNDDHYVSALVSPIRVAGAPRQFGINVLKTF
jgi:iron complex outermembrane recepter protein